VKGSKPEEKVAVKVACAFGLTAISLSGFRVNTGRVVVLIVGSDKEATVGG
jgi:hypothetical protein